MVRCSDCGRPSTRARCHSCVTRDNHRRGVFAQTVRGDHWTPEEEDQLRIMARSLSAAQIGAQIGRTKSAVQNRAHRLGVYLQTDDWTVNRLCALFGTYPATIVHAWIDSGLLRARHLPPGDHCRQGEWRITEADLERFLIEAPWAYDARRMVPQTHRLAELATRVQRRDPWVDLPYACAHLQLSAAAVQRWIALGVLPAKRRHVGKQGGVHGHLVMREADVAAAAETIRDRQRAARDGRTANLIASRRRRLAEPRMAA